MLRGGVIVLVAFFSVIILKRKLYSHHYLGMLLVITGVTMVGVSAILDTKSDNSSGSQALGVILIASSLILQAGLFVSEEIIFQHRHFEPMECVGGEGQFYIILIFNKFRDSFREFSILEF
jgi:drug/metabolite transporter (DMT)-like permease